MFLCCAVTVGQPTMLLLAFIGGFFWDAQCALGPHGGDPEVYTQQVENLRFGYSILLFGGMGFLMQGIQPLFKQGKWQFSAMLSGIAVLLYLAAEYAIINFVRGDFVLNQATMLPDGIHLRAHHAVLAAHLLDALPHREDLRPLHQPRSRPPPPRAPLITMEPGYRLRLYLLTALVLVGFGALLTRLHEFQIERRNEFLNQVPGNRTVTVREPGIRGEITDRNGITLARNLRKYEVSFNLEEIREAYLAQHEEDPTIERLTKEDGITRKRSEKDIVSIVKDGNESTIGRLRKLGLAENYNASALRTHYPHPRRTHSLQLPRGSDL